MSEDFKIILVASEEQSSMHQDFLSEISQVYTVKSIDDVENVVNQAHTFLLLGGDGSLNYLLNEVLAKSSIDHRVIYFPTGTANDFARSLKLNIGLPTLAKLQDLLTYDRTISVPVMKCNERHFINVASIGAPAQVTSSGSDLLKKLVGKFSYYLSGIEKVIKPDQYQVTVELDNSNESESYLTPGFIVSQGQFAGGGIKVSTGYCPRFNNKFNFIITKGQEISKMLLAVIELQKDIPLINDDDLLSREVELLEINSTEPLPVKLDGEELTSQRLIFSKAKQKLLFYLH